MKKLIISSFILFCFNASALQDFVSTVKKVKPSIVGIGTYSPLGSPQNVLHGTGFVIGNGKYIITNYHVVPKDGVLEDKKKWVIFTGIGKNAKVYEAQLIAFSEVHDLAILSHNGPRSPAIKLASSDFIEEGLGIAFTGFPIGGVLGLYPVSHRGYISSITPMVIPARTSTQLSASNIRMLKNPYMVYQLDATAYPGNSGSPVYTIDTGEVIAVINKVFVQQSKESAITNPSGITYAIPVKFVHELLAKEKININQ